MLLAGPFIGLELLHLLAVHVLHDLIGLPFLETEPHAFVRVVLVVGLIFVVFDLNEVGIDGLWIKGQADEGVDGGGFGDEFEGPRL